MQVRACWHGIPCTAAEAQRRMKHDDIIPAVITAAIELMRQYSNRVDRSKLPDRDRGGDIEKMVC